MAPPPPADAPALAAAPTAVAPAARAAAPSHMTTEMAGQRATVTEQPFVAEQPFVQPFVQPFLAERPAEPLLTIPMNTGIGSRLVALFRRVPVRGLGLAGLSAATMVLLGTIGMKMFAAGSGRGAVSLAAPAPLSSGDHPPVAPTDPSSSSLPPPPLAPEPPPPPAAPVAAHHPRPAAASEAAPPPPQPPAKAHKVAQKIAVKHAVKARAAVKRAVRGAPRLATRRRAAVHSVVASAETASSAESDRIARAREAYGRGNERLFQGDAPAAIAAYEEAVRLNPKDAAGYRGLGLAYAQQGKRTEAVRYLKAYLKHARDVDDRALISNRIALLSGNGS